MAEAAAKRAKTATTGGDIAVYMGEEGSLSHSAATRFFKNSPSTTLSGVNSFGGVFNAVSAGEAMYGIIPIENSSSGTLRSTYDLLVKHDVSIGGEIGVRETYCLCSKGPIELSAVRAVLSHPTIIEACSSFVETKIAGEVELVPTLSTTEATKRVAGGEGAKGEVSVAIATREAAVRHGLKVIAEDIGNDQFLETRYILIHRNPAVNGRPAPFPHDAIDPVKKRSVCFALPNEAGAAYKLLSCWALRGVNVLKVETRPLNVGHGTVSGLPVSTQLWDYFFYVDYLVPPGQTAQDAAKLEAALEEFSLWKKDFGAYPSVITRAEKKAQSWDEMVDMMCKA